MDDVAGDAGDFALDPLLVLAVIAAGDLSVDLGADGKLRAPSLLLGHQGFQVFL